jgi:hypothetical protein
VLTCTEKPRINESEGTQKIFLHSMGFVFAGDFYYKTNYVQRDLKLSSLLEGFCYWRDRYTEVSVYFLVRETTVKQNC